ncbi:unnamed protein product [Chilo suppressalis]|uniref:Uncharacterized protein n=1 Tax=Chilo suppressalis TaxID=168631 RepID=A0ABN8BAG4_CHISP|nr:unnamed protein product [Chilo suppressalis]
MEDLSERSRRQHSDNRRLETPGRSSRRDGASHSQSCPRSPRRDRSRSQLQVKNRNAQDADLQRDRERVKALENHLLKERRRLLQAEERMCSSSSRRNREDRTRSPSHHSVRRTTTGQRSRQHGSVNGAAEPRVDEGHMTSELSVETLLQQVNKKLDIIYKIEKRFEDLQDTVEFYAEQYQMMIDFKKTTEKKFKALEQKNVFLEKQNQALEERILELEQKEKDKNVEIVGLEKEKDEEIVDIVKKIPITLNLEAEDITDAKRVGTTIGSSAMEAG